VRLHFKYTGSAPTNTDCNNIAASLHAAVAAGPILSTVSSTILTSTRVIDLSDPAAGAGVHAQSIPGTAGADELPAAACVLINFLVQRRYRGGKPRVYWPMGQQTDLGDAQKWTPAAVTNFQNHFNTYITQALAVAWAGGSIASNVSVSYYEGVNPPITLPSGRVKQSSKLRTGPPLVDAVIGAPVNSRIGTQRRRIRGTGT
jgi:hypothetical protein